MVVISNVNECRAQLNQNVAITLTNAPFIEELLSTKITTTTSWCTPQIMVARRMRTLFDTTSSTGGGLMCKKHRCSCQNNILPLSF